MRVLCCTGIALFVLASTPLLAGSAALSSAPAGVSLETPDESIEAQLDASRRHVTVWQGKGAGRVLKAQLAVYGEDNGGAGGRIELHENGGDWFTFYEHWGADLNSQSCQFYTDEFGNTCLPCVFLHHRPHHQAVIKITAGVLTVCPDTADHRRQMNHHRGVRVIVIHADDVRFLSQVIIPAAWDDHLACAERLQMLDQM